MNQQLENLYAQKVASIPQDRQLNAAKIYNGFTELFVQKISLIQFTAELEDAYNTPSYAGNICTGIGIFFAIIGVFSGGEGVISGAFWLVSLYFLGKYIDKKRSGKFGKDYVAGLVINGTFEPKDQSQKNPSFTFTKSDEFEAEKSSSNEGFAFDSSRFTDKQTAEYYEQMKKNAFDTKYNARERAEFMKWCLMADEGQIAGVKALPPPP